MKALKTIVATAVIVFTLTTVAMAGVQHLTRRSDEATSAGQAHQATAQPAAQGGVTLSTRQFAALMRTVRNGGSQDRTPARTHDGAQSRAHVRQQSHPHTVSGSAGSGSSAGATHQTAAQHTETHHTTTPTTTHDGGTHNGGTHNGGTHDGGTHDGGGDSGCD